MGLRLKPGTQPGSRHRVKGKGIVTDKATGDLIVTVDVVVPTSLNDDEQKIIDQLSDVLRNPRVQKAGKS